MVVGVAGCSTCLIIGDFIAPVDVHGIIVDQKTGRPLGGIGLGLTFFEGGKEIEFVTPPSPGQQQGYFTQEDGMFRIRILVGSSCTTLLGTEYLLPFRRIDRVVVIAVRDGCQSEHVVDLEPAGEIGFEQENLIELNEPLRIPPCEASDNKAGP